MAIKDTCCSIHPYFTVKEGKLQEFKAVCERMVAATSEEPGCLYYGFTFDGIEASCREGYADGDALLAHAQHVGPLLGEAMQYADLTRMEVQGPEEELSKVRGPMADLSPRFYSLEVGFRR
ncbi:MAG: antibiotic biosynthesis monooxygenase [Thermoleophilia bacterium]|nr:antibiotic biosynthesis monooxygenase [Thermoleophilia bacterium]